MSATDSTKFLNSGKPAFATTSASGQKETLFVVRHSLAVKSTSA